MRLPPPSPDFPTCAARVYSSGAFTGYGCPNRAKWLVRTSTSVSRYCGVHVRKYKGNRRVTVEPLT